MVMLKQCIKIIKEIQRTNLKVTMDKLRLETPDVSRERIRMAIKL